MSSEKRLELIKRVAYRSFVADVKTFLQLKDNEILTCDQWALLNDNKRMNEAARYTNEQLVALLLAGTNERD